MYASVVPPLSVLSTTLTSLSPGLGVGLPVIGSSVVPVAVLILTVPSDCSSLYWLSFNWTSARGPVPDQMTCPLASYLSTLDRIVAASSPPDDT